MKEITVEQVKALLNLVKNDPEEVIIVEGEVYDYYVEGEVCGLWRDNESVYLPIDDDQNRRFYLKDGRIVVKGDTTWKDGDDDWSDRDVVISRYTKAELFIA